MKKVLIIVPLVFGIVYAKEYTGVFKTNMGGKSYELSVMCKNFEAETFSFKSHEGSYNFGKLHIKGETYSIEDKIIVYGQAGNIGSHNGVMFNIHDKGTRYVSGFSQLIKGTRHKSTKWTKKDNGIIGTTLMTKDTGDSELINYEIICK